MGLFYLYSSPNIVRVIKSKIIRWAGHVVIMEEGLVGGGNVREVTTWETKA
jgi:hypothetical protein